MHLVVGFCSSFLKVRNQLGRKKTAANCKLPDDHFPVVAPKTTRFENRSLHSPRKNIPQWTNQMIQAPQSKPDNKTSIENTHSSRENSEAQITFTFRREEMHQIFRGSRHR